ncbi:hypothetical protein [Sandaracinobacteroides hominis]|uniref:hypothetical protein n=1 Tax=Sandaracinobacteroides hominis TaxID=2780086 RepID=UPI0018F73088|nr:hypothetical protein [Sandaracinobacteroides hominis]
MTSPHSNSSSDRVEELLEDASSQLLALGDALDSRQPAAIARTLEMVLRIRGMDSLAIAGGVDRAYLRAALVRLAPEDCDLLRKLVAQLLADVSLPDHPAGSC